MSEISLIKKIEDSYLEATPSLELRVFQNSNQIFDHKFGKEYSYYDIASLTKIVFTTTAIMALESTSDFNSEDLVSKYIEDFPFKEITVSNLLQHHAGLNWWYPYYEDLRDGELWGDSYQVQWQKLQEKLLEEKQQDLAKAIYSDLDFFFLGEILRKAYDLELPEIFDIIKNNMELENSFFHINNIPKYSIEKYAPTEEIAYRNGLIQGLVHDDNTWALGGVSSHAGLFSNMEDLSKWVAYIRNSLINGSRFLKKTVVQKYTSRSLDESIGDWALGFMMPTKGKASCGKYFSLDSFGHTGFTGTSIWFDPTKDLQVIILSNRVHPTRDNKKFVTYRPELHNWIYEEIIS